MDSRHFLANVYFGSLKADLIHSYREEEAEEKTREVIVKFAELSEQYPPHVLEQAGTVPKELLVSFYMLHIVEILAEVIYSHQSQTL